MIIETKDLTRQYSKVVTRKFLHKTKKTFNAVQNVSLKINQGEHIGLVGLNGSGKSTLTKMILGILQPTGGVVKTFGLDPIKNRQKNASKIGVVFGQRSQLRWDLPPIDTFKLNREIYQVPLSIYNQRVKKMADLLDANDFLLQPVRNLSLGQRMKAEFIAALIHGPKLIILDEPTIGLDVVSKNSIVNFLNTLKDKTIIFTSHDLDEVEKACSRVVILNHGHLILDKSSQELLDLKIPSTITFSVQDGKYDNVQDYFPNINLLENGNYQITNVKQAEVKLILNKITTNLPVTNLEVKSSKLEYLLAHVNRWENIYEI